MNKFSLLPLIVACSTVQVAQAQEVATYPIKLQIVDSAAQALSFSDVYLLNSKDSSIVATSLPDENGQVIIDAPSSPYILFIKTEEFEDYTQLIQLGQSELNLGTIVLKAKTDNNVYNEVVITGQQSIMELKIDKRVYNVSADINNQGGSASDVLENIPSVTVDAEGNVSLRGNANVRILVDGKLSGFATTADALKMLQADAIDRIEVITNASSRYDAEGDAGVINIILKKEKKHGFNAVLNLKSGYYPDHGLGLRVNYKKNKLNLFADVNGGFFNFPGNSSTDQLLSNTDTFIKYYQTYKHERKKWRFGARVGADYDWNKNNNTSFDVNYRLGDGNNTITRQYDNYNTENVLFNIDKRIEHQTEDEQMIELNLSHTYTFMEKGSWRTALGMTFDRDDENSDYDETSSMTGLKKIEQSFALVNERIMQMQSDFIYPISDNGKVELGVKYQNRNFQNEYGYRMQVSPTEWASPARYNDLVEYDDKVYAAYLMGSESFGDWGVQAGLRAEYSEIYTLLKSDGEKKNLDFLNLFPSAAVSYKINDYNNIQWSLSRRIRRPGQWDLIPFRKFGDNREMMIGNPNLKPELTYSTEITWMNYLPKGSILSSIYYRNTQDKIERIAFYGTDGVIYREPLNIANSQSMGAELIFNYQITRWLRFNTNFNLYHQNINGEYGGQNFDREIWAWTNRTSANIVLPNDIKTQLSFQYESPRVNPQGRVLHVKWMDLAMSKDILNQKATIGFNVRDLFNSRIHRQIIETSELNSTTHFQWRQRSFMLTFTYRLNHNMKDIPQKRDNFFEESGMD